MSGDADRPWLASYAPDVPADFDFPSVPLTHLLDEAAAAFPGNVALSFSGRRLTYRELRDHVDRFAGGLEELGVRAGDRVALVLPNCPQHVVGFFAVLRLGAIVVHCNPQSTVDELRHQFATTGVVAAICLDLVHDTVEAAAGPDVKLVVGTLKDYEPAWRRPFAPRAWWAMMRRSRPARQARFDPAKQVAVLQFTGGTSGVPKPAMLTHANLVANAYQTRLWMPDATAGREVTLTVLPLFHVYGLTLCLLTTVLLAGRLVLLPRFDTALVFAAVDDERPTLFPGVPPIYQAIADDAEVRRHDLHSIRVCLSGAMRLPAATQERFERITGGRVVEGYGMTETSPATLCNPLSSKGKPGTVGIPLPGTYARIVDPVDGVGELAVKGPQVFAGYWGEDSSPVEGDGWLLTGDLATMDADGFVTIVDRKKDLIIAGGFNVYPAEVEAVLSSHPAVADCCVAGLPDRYRGETVKAYVVVHEGATMTEDEVRAHCAASLSAYKVPKLVEFRDELPKTAVGKALRRLLVEQEPEAAT